MRRPSPLHQREQRLQVRHLGRGTLEVDVHHPPPGQISRPVGIQVGDGGVLVVKVVLEGVAVIGIVVAFGVDLEIS